MKNTIPIVKIFAASSCQSDSNAIAPFSHKSYEKRLNDVSEATFIYLRSLLPLEILGTSCVSLSKSIRAGYSEFTLSLLYESNRNTDEIIIQFAEDFRDAIKEAVSGVTQSIDISPHNPSAVIISAQILSHYPTSRVILGSMALGLVEVLRPIVSAGWHPEIVFQIADSEYHLEQHDPSPKFCDTQEHISALIIEVGLSMCLIHHRRREWLTYNPELRPELEEHAGQPYTLSIIYAPSYSFRAGSRKQHKGEIISLVGVDQMHIW